MLSGGMPGDHADEWLTALTATGHPEAPVLTEALRRHLADDPDQALPVIHQLKVTLIGVRPPVWREVQVPAAATLGMLHEVIQVLFGWDGDHLHLFTVGRHRYADPFFDLDARDEDAIRLSEALPSRGQPIRYVYDLGDEWRHEITLQDARPAEQGVRYPVCVGGRGDAPWEDWHPDMAEEQGLGPGAGATPYDPAEINRRLTALLAADPPR